MTKTREILKALHRVHREFETITKKNIERMGMISHQILYFEEMPECSQNLVIDDLFKDMNTFGWNEWLKQLEQKK